MRWSNLGRDAEGDLRDGLGGAWALCKAQGCVVSVNLCVCVVSRDGLELPKCTSLDACAVKRVCVRVVLGWSRNDQSAPNVMPVQ